MSTETDIPPPATPSTPGLPRVSTYNDPSSVSQDETKPVEVPPPVVHKRSDPRMIKPSQNFHLNVQASLLASDAPPQDFRGLYNLAGIVLFVMNFRLVIENLQKYGLLVKVSTHLFDEFHRTWPGLITLVSMIVLGPTLSFLIELYTVRGKFTAKQAIGLQTALICTIFFGPITLIYVTYAHLEVGLALMFISVIISMKLVSFTHVCDDLREEVLTEKDKKPVEPTLGHMYYFMAAPTLIYQTSYPRSERIRKRFVLRRLAELLFCLALQFFLVEQYVVPTVRNSLRYMDNGDWMPMIERVLKLAIPNTAIWLLMFFALFHSWLNLTAELLRFGDRLFYKDWWNAHSLDIYWRYWNLPVHNWILRHVYAPLLRRKISNYVALLFSFLLSAVLHEVLISVPCHTVRLWAFWGMLLQVPMIMLTHLVGRVLKMPVWGNVIFWFFFLVLGQPLIIMLYAHTYIRQHFESF